VSERNGIRLQVITMLLSILQVIVMGMGAYILNDIHDRVVRLENLNLGEKDEKTRPVLSGVDRDRVPPERR
jgi:hypothetical protein